MFVFWLGNSYQNEIIFWVVVAALQTQYPLLISDWRLWEAVVSLSEPSQHSPAELCSVNIYQNSNILRLCLSLSLVSIYVRLPSKQTFNWWFEMINNIWCEKYQSVFSGVLCLTSCLCCFEGYFKETSVTGLSPLILDTNTVSCFSINSQNPCRKINWKPGKLNKIERTLQTNGSKLLEQGSFIIRNLIL